MIDRHQETISPAPQRGRGDVHSPWSEGKVCVEEQELDLREVFLVLRRWLKLLVILPVIAAAAAGLVSYNLMTPVYRASTTLWVVEENAAGPTYDDLLMSRDLTRTYAEVAKSRSVMEDVIRRLNLVGITPEDLQKKLSVKPVNDTELIAIAMKDPDPEMAARLADAVAASFQNQIPKFMRLRNVAVVDPARVPLKPDQPRPLLNITVAFALGAIAAVGLAFLLEYMDTSVKTPEELSRYADLPVLAVIPELASEKGAVRGRRRRRKVHRN